MVYVGFDFGTKSWGCAVGEGASLTVRALPAIQAINGQPNWDEIDQHIKVWHPVGLVIGYPLKLDGQRFALTDKVDEAILQLQSRYPNLPIIKADERLSTVTAKDRLFAEGGKKALIKGRIDSESAKVILQDWFETRLFDDTSA